MNILIIYDSLYGNTEKIAHAIAKGFRKSDTVSTVTAGHARVTQLGSADLLIVGSPTQGGKPKPALQQFLDSISPTALKGIRTAAFDTRFLEQKQNFALRWLMKKIGCAAPKIAAILQSKGGSAVAEPEGFIVEGKTGPLQDGEIARAAVWAKRMIRPSR